MHSAAFKIEDVFSIAGRGIVITGTLEYGVIRKGMKTSIAGKEAEVLSIELFRKKLEELSEPGSNAGLLLKGGPSREDIPKGYVYFE